MLSLCGYHYTSGDPPGLRHVSRFRGTVKACNTCDIRAYFWVEPREIDYDRPNNWFEGRFNIAFGWGPMNSHIADRAGFLAALAKDDPERVQAEEHARGCAPCREAFAEGLGLVALL